MKNKILLPIALIMVSGSAYSLFPALDIPIDIPDLGGLLEPEAVISTGLDDAIYECPEMDGFEPEFFTPLYDMPVCPDGSILLLPGAYEFEARSFCLHAGSYVSETGGNGYIYAPLEGSRSEVIQSILERSSIHEDIPQTAVQSLIWAILARCKFSDMSEYLQNAASELLTPQEIFELNGGALGLIPDDMMDDLIGEFSEPVRAALEAEARIRSTLSSVESSYEDLEEIAVFHGDPPEEYNERYIPEGRWSLHPDGYYIRYFPTGYKRTRVEIWIPEDEGAGLSFSSELNSSYGIAFGKAPYRLRKDSSSPYKDPRVLQKFIPDGGGTAQPGNTLSQRLAVALGKSQTDVNEAIARVRDSMDKFSTISSILTFDITCLFDAGGELKGWIFGVVLDKVISTWSGVIKSISSDPPRSDYTIYAIPSVVNIDSIIPGGDLSAEKAAALNSFAEVSMELIATLQAAQISLDRMGGAFEADDEYWTYEQAFCYIYYKRLSGVLMETAADRFDYLFDVCRSEGMQDIQVTTFMASEYLDNLEENGFPDEAIEAAHLMGMTDEKIQDILEIRLSLTPEELEGSMFEAADDCISFLHECGAQWQRMPEVYPYWLEDE